MDCGNGAVGGGKKIVVAVGFGRVIEVVPVGRFVCQGCNPDGLWDCYG